jgi:hypothetical protein
MLSSRSRRLCAGRERTELGNTLHIGLTFGAWKALAEKAARTALRSCEGMKEREAKIPPQAKARLTQALERLVRLYDAWAKPEEATKWKKALDETKEADKRP